MKIITDITREDYADFTKHVYLKKGLKRHILVGIVLIVCLEISLNQTLSLIPTIVSGIFSLGVYAFVIFYSLDRTRKIPDKNGTILGKKELEFAEDKIYYKTDHGEGNYNWSTIKSLSESRKSFYLYVDTNMAILIPKRAFETEAAQNEFRSLVEQKTGKV